jgi:hypothetical protein
MSIACKKVWEHVSEYLDHQLDSPLLHDMDVHLENCEICSAIVDSTRNVLVLTCDDRTFELPLGYTDRLHARLRLLIQGPGPNSS